MKIARYIQDVIDIVRQKKEIKISLSKNYGCSNHLTFEKSKHIYNPSLEKKNNKILLVYPNNFLKNNAGNNAYTYNIVNGLKSLGFTIDWFSGFKNIEDFNNYEELNNKSRNLINNLFLYKGPHKFSKHKYYKASWVCDGALEYFQYVLSQNEYDFVYVHYVSYLDFVRLTRIPNSTKIVHSIHDNNALQMFYGNHKFNEIGYNIEQEINMLGYCDDILCISSDELQFFSRFYPEKNFHLLPFFKENTILPKISKTIDCLFVGYSNPHNKKSVLWFVDNVFEHLKPGIKVTICGKVCEMIRNENPEDYNKMQEMGIETIDFAPNLDEVYAKTKISIVPMLAGTGLKVKTVSSMAYGIPVVATSLGVDGFIDKTENGCLVSDDPVEFAGYINRLLEDENFYKLTVKKMNDYYQKHFTPEENIEVLKKAFI